MKIRITLVTGVLMLVIIDIVCLIYVTERVPSAMPRQTFHWVSVSSIDHHDLIDVKDGNIYIDGVQFPDADAATLMFAVDQTNSIIEYAKDKNHVYYIGPPYWGDNNQLTLDGIEIISADPATFSPIFGIPLTKSLPTMTLNWIAADNYNWQCLYDSYGMDETHDYYQNYLIAGADPNTFDIIFDEYGCPTNYDRDAHHIYFDIGGDQASLTLPQDVDLASFKVLNESYVEDKNHVYNKAGFPISDSPSEFVLFKAPQLCGPDCVYDARDGSQDFNNGDVIQ